MPPSRLEHRKDLLVIPLSRDERRRLDAWAHEQEREASQAIRYALRGILAGLSDLQTDESAPHATTPTREIRPVLSPARDSDGQSGS